MEPGEQVGDYIIVRQIGEGGMSVVYLAEHKATSHSGSRKAAAPATRSQ